MKLKGLLVLIAVLCLVGTTSAINLNFQNPSDNSSVLGRANSGVGSLTWKETTTGGNNYIQISSIGANSYCMMNPSASVTTYAAATKVTATEDPAGTTLSVRLYDGAFGSLYAWAPNNHVAAARYEVKLSGGQAYVYQNGVLVATSGALAQNPSYVGFCEYNAGSPGVGWDDFVYGQAENKVVLGLPESDGDKFIIMDDIINLANSGLWNTTSNSQQDANYMSGWWSTGNNSATPPESPILLENQSIQLVFYPSGTVYATNYTKGNANFTGTVTIDIKTLLIDSGAPDGYYALTIPGTGAYSNLIVKRSNGATVTWDKDTYSTGDADAVISVVVDGAYWDPGTYTYKVAVMDVYGLFYGTNQTISTSTTTVTHDWEETNSPGVYYAILYGTTAGGNQYIFGIDYADVTADVNFHGYVNNAQTGAVVSGANINFTQLSTITDNTTGVSGAYTANGYATGAPLYINVTAAGFIQYLYNFTPMVSKTIDLNISLVPAAPTYTGLGIGGVARDSAYGRPLSGATVYLKNTTNTELYTKTTSTFGWYLCDEGTSCFLTTVRPYDVWGEKVGYGNSANYSAVTA